jgi:alpha-N-arabinofuranosidase
MSEESGFSIVESSQQDSTTPAHSVNTLEAPDTVAPKPIAAAVHGGTVTLTLEPKSVTVISVQH